MASYYRRYWPRNITATILLLVVAIIVIRLAANRLRNGTRADDNDDFVPPQIDFPRHSDFARTLREVASDDNTVVIAVIDANYAEVALNFYASSIKRHGIENMIYVSLDEGTCDILAGAFPEMRHRCFLHKDISAASDTVLQQSRNYKEKTYLRRFFILEALKLRHNVIVTDVDMVFVGNPLADIKRTCGRCDLAIMWDGHQENYDGGLVFAKATDRTITFYNRLASYELSHGTGRLALNTALKETKKKKLALKVETLSTKKYKVGIEFFAHNSCPEKKAYKGVLVIHNNYIMEAPNKVFRLKECMLWDWDGFDGYFTNASRRYLTVESAGPRGHPEHQSLLNAFSLAKLLHRTVVLPYLECKKSKCNLLMRMYDHSHLHFIGRFNSVTAGNYRECTFLSNPRVPSAIKDSNSPMFHIAFRDDNTKVTSHGEPVRHLVPKDLNAGPTVREIFGWLAGRPERVIRFDSLTGWFSHINHVNILGENLVKIIREL
ncbi:hypothetical protein LSH36_278g06045 [Paralvinella palmiformis]|uniref:Nucleotide-diphospho-sugar transferase domain-containing protein n=1 Tax=Paralvinella palmiformis TaxID=53620 RepID=A0AAD9JKD7_9ANNE|nr:hypothetical protein LSH36_278g06045 [Paralvinella palmiformis]